MFILIIVPLLVISGSPKQALTMSKSIAQSGKDLFGRIDVQEEESANELDPEERAHMSNFPDNFSTSDCSKEFGDEDKVVFPCPPLDTQPIEDYKRKHGDPSQLGINGEKAALLGV